MDKLIEQIIIQFPVVLLMFYLFKGREERISTVEKRLDECLEDRVTDNKALLDLIKK